MRVLFLTTAYPSQATDPRGHHVHNLARQLVDAGAQVGVVSPTLPGAAPREVLDGVDVRRFRYSPLGREQLAKGVGGIMPNLRAKPLLAMQVPPLVGQLYRAAKRVVAGYDVIHAHWVYPTGIVALRLGRKAGIPVVVTAHGGDVNSAVGTMGLRSLVRRVGNAADHVLAVSQDLVDKLIQIGVAPDRVTLVPLGVDPFERSDRSSVQVPKAVFVGSLIKRKGVDTLLEALEHLEAGSVEIEIVGDGPERRDLEAMAALAPMPVTFRGSIPPSDVAAILGDADLLVLPSRSEGRPVVIMEAMAAGMAVVASDIPGTRELVSHGSTGLLFHVADPRSLADAMRRLCQDPVLRSQLGAAALESLHRKGLTGRAAAQRHLAIYEGVCATSAPQGQGAPGHE